MATFTNVFVDSEVGGCVYKFWAGNKYLIIKGKSLSGSIYFLQNGYATFLNGQKESDGVNSYYFKFYRYIYNNPGIPCQIEVLLESSDTYALLKREQQELDRAIRDTNCLNNNIEAYIPKYKKGTKHYGWIPKGVVSNFNRYRK